VKLVNKRTQQVDAETRIHLELKMFKEDARRSGRALSEELKKQNVPPETIAALLKLDREIKAAKPAFY
jgi:hypothetical protein